MAGAGRRREVHGWAWNQIHQGALLPTLPLMTRKEPLPLLRTQWGGGWGVGGLRGWVGLKRAPKGLLAGAWVPVEAGTGEHLPYPQTCLPALWPAPAIPRSGVSHADYNSRGAPRSHAPPLAPSHPHPPPPNPLQPEVGERSVAGRGAGLATGDSGTLAYPTNQPWIPPDTPEARPPPR